MTQSRIALILGATGGVGHETARALAARGWQIRALTRNLAKAEAKASLPGMEWVRGDAMNREDVMSAAQGASLIFHGVNPPGYRNWAELAVPMLRNSIAAARQTGAHLLFPGTVYNYGPDAFPLLTETSPQRPRTRKGKIRVEMEKALVTFARDGGRVTILRAGDFFGPHTGNSWFSEGMIKPGKPLRSITDPGKPGVGHNWAYLPDVGETFAALAEDHPAPHHFESYHFGGHWFEDGREFAERIRITSGQEDIPIRRLPWRLMLLISPVVPLFHELAEMRYLWRRPVRLDNQKLIARLGYEPHTDIDAALRVSLSALGCLPQTA